MGRRKAQTLRNGTGNRKDGQARHGRVKYRSSNRFRSMKQGSLEDYHRRLLTALVHVQTHLDDDLPLDELAQVAGFSSFHFHRIFRSIVGESVKEHIRRLRLERAAHQLRHSSEPVTSLALEAGYETHESFSRAFRKAFRRSPLSFRQARGIRMTRTRGTLVRYDRSGARAGFRPLPAPSRRNPASMAVRFEKLPQWRVAFVRHTGPYADADIAIRRLAQWAGPQGLLNRDAVIFGIAHDDPDVTPAWSLRFDAALGIPDGVTPSARGVGVQVLPAKTYAVTEHRGSYETLGNTYSRFCGEWLPSSGRLALPGPALEFYLNSPHDTPKRHLRTEIFLPVVP